MNQRWAAALGVVGAFSLIGCGGRSQSSGAEPELGEAPPSVAVEAAAPRGLCDESPRPLRVRKVWERAEYLYGLANTPFFAVSVSGQELLVPTDQYGMLGHQLYAVADGTLLGNVAPRVLDRDRAWSRELRVSDEHATLGHVSLIDLQRNRPLLELGDRSQVVRLSPDGQYLFGWYGRELERLRIADGAVTKVDVSASVDAEPGYYDQYPPAFVLSDANRRGAVATGGTTLTVVDFESGTAEARELYDPIVSDDWPRSDTLLTLALAPRERALATVDGAGRLRLWHYPELTQYGPDIALGVTRGFRDCYCTPRNFSRVAWSADERFLATRDEMGATVVRRACDGAVVATLPELTSPTPSVWGRPGPAFLAFTPRGDGLAVLHLTESFDGVVAYYALSE